MDYKIKQYEILSKKNIEENKIVTISDLNWDESTSLNEMKDLIVIINDILPKYVFILGNVCSYYDLQNKIFNDKLTYFFELLSCITNSFIVFGNKDYLLDKESKIYLDNIENLLNYYKKAIPFYVHNCITSDNELNIVGFDKNHLNYNNLDEARKELLNLLNNLTTIDKNKFNILITHYELNRLKMDKKLLETFDLILTGSNEKTTKKKIFDFSKNDNQEETFENKAIIKTGGVSKGEISFIKIKKL